MFPFRDSVTHSGCGGGRVTRAKKLGRGFWTLPSKPAKQVFWLRPLYSERVVAAIACCAGAARDELRILDQGQCSLPETETMQESRFREWLDKQEKRGGWSLRSRDRRAVHLWTPRASKRSTGISTSSTRRTALPRFFKSLSMRQLEYAATARKQDSPNPKGLHGPGYKSAVNAYRKFCDWAAGRADARGFRDGG